MPGIGRKIKEWCERSRRRRVHVKREYVEEPEIEMINETSKDHRSYHKVFFRDNFDSRMDHVKAVKELFGFTDGEKIDIVKVMIEHGIRLEHVSSGTIGNVFVLVAGGIMTDVAVKISGYRRTTCSDIDSDKFQVNAEYKIMKKLEELVVKNHTPHVVMPIAHVKMDLKLMNDKNLRSYTDKHLKQFIDNIRSGIFHEEGSMIFMEYFGYGTLDNMIIEHIKKDRFKKYWRPMLFQIISGLAVVQYYYPNFRHNNLKATKIVIHKPNKKDTTKKYRYTINKKRYEMTPFNRVPMMINFDWSCMDGEVDNDMTESKFGKRINVVSDKNRYYDMYYILNTIRMWARMRKMIQYIPQDALNFINRIAPDHKNGDSYFIVSDKGRILHNEEVFTPVQVLEEDEYFAEYRIVDD